MKLFKRAALPATVFAAVFALHFLWHGIFPEIPAEQSRWAVVNTEASWMRTYLESQSYWLGFSYALSLAFA